MIIKKVFEKKVVGHQFYCWNNEPVYISLEKKINIGSKILAYGEYYTFSIVNNRFLWTVRDDNVAITEIYDLETKKNSYKGNYIVTKTSNYVNINIDNVILGFTKFENIKYWAKINIETFEIIEKFPIDYGPNGIWYLIGQDKFLSQWKGKQILSCHLLKDQTELWQFNLKEVYGKYINWEGKEVEHKIEKIYVYEDLVLVGVRDRGTTALNAQTGQIVYEQKLIGGYNTYMEEGKMYMLGGHMIETEKSRFFGGLWRCMDIKTGEIIHESKHDWIFEASTGIGIYGKYACFGSMFNEGITILEKETGNLVCKIPHDAGLATDDVPQIHGNRVFVHDMMNNLTVYEVEELDA